MRPRSLTARLCCLAQARMSPGRCRLAAVGPAFRQAVAALRGLVTGQLRVGIVMPLPDRRVVRAIGAFGRTYPGIELTLVEDETDALLGALAAGDLDTAFLGLGPGQDPPASLQAIVVAREPAVLAVHPQHPLAARRSVPLTALRDEPVVTLTRASRLRTVLETACRHVGFAPRIVAETSDLTVMVQLVAEGIGVALMPRSGPEEAADGATITITHPVIDRRITLVWRPGAASPQHGRSSHSRENTSASRPPRHEGDQQARAANHGPRRKRRARESARC